MTNFYIKHEFPNLFEPFVDFIFHTSIVVTNFCKLV